MKQRLEDIAESLAEETLATLPEEDGPSAYHVARALGRDLSRRAGVAASYAGRTLERLLWGAVIEPFGGCLPFTLKERIQDSVGEEKFHAARATKKSYVLKGALAGAAAYLTALPAYPDSAFFIGAMTGAGYGFSEVIIRSMASLHRYGWLSSGPLSERTRKKYRENSDYQHLSGEPVGIFIGWLYQGAEGIIKGAGGWWSSIMEDAARDAEGKDL